MKRCIALLGLAAAASLIAMDGKANTITWKLGTLLNGTAPTSSSPWMTAEFTDVGAGVNQVKVTFTSSLNVASEFIDQVAFNVKPSILPSSIGIVNDTPLDPAVVSVLHTTQNAYDITGGGDAGKGFDIMIKWSTASNDGGVHRFNGSDVEKFTFTLTGLTVADFAYKNTIVTGHNITPGDVYIAAHVQGIPVPGSTTTTSGAVRDGTVPDGGTTALLLGMVAMGLGF